MVQSFANRGEKYHWRRLASLRVYSFKRLIKGLRHHYHARPSAEWPIIDPTVISQSKITRICETNIYLTGLKSTASNARF
jgi:hypothetical protein